MAYGTYFDDDILSFQEEEEEEDVVDESRIFGSPAGEVLSSAGVKAVPGFIGLDESQLSRGSGAPGLTSRRAPKTKAEAAWERVDQMASERPERPKPGFWRNLAAFGAGTVAGYLNADGRVRSRVDVPQVVNRVRFGDYDIKRADWGEKVGAATAAAKAAEAGEMRNERSRRTSAYEEFMTAQAEKMRRPPVPKSVPPRYFELNDEIYVVGSDGVGSKVPGIPGKAAKPEKEAPWVDSGIDDQGYMMVRRGDVVKRAVGPDGKPVKGGKTAASGGISPAQQERWRREDERERQRNNERSAGRYDAALKAAETEFNTKVEGLNRETQSRIQALHKQRANPNSDVGQVDDEIKRVESEHENRLYALEKNLTKKKTSAESAMRRNAPEGRKPIDYPNAYLQRMNVKMPIINGVELPVEKVQKWADERFNGDVKAALADLTAEAKRKKYRVE